MEEKVENLQNEESEKELEVAEPTTEEVTDEVTKNPEEESETVGEVLTDTSSEEESEIDREKKEKVPQSKEDNSKYAEARRKAEKEAEIKIKEAYEKGKAEAYIGKINPYTNEEIKDLQDVEVYETMYEIERSGKDPIQDFSKAIADKRRVDYQRKQKEKEIEEKVKKDVEDFSKKYPDININQLLANETFSDYMDGKTKPLVDIYESYERLKNTFRNNAIETAKNTISNSKSSPGSLNGGTEIKYDYATMSSADFQKEVDRVLSQ